MPRRVFRDWRPDLPDLLNPGVTQARNTVPLAGAFGPRKTLLDAGESALATTVLGGWAARDASNKAHSFAGELDKLNRVYTAGVVDASRAGGYATGSTERWNFQTFGNLVIATNYSDQLQFFDLRTSALFADVAGDFVPRVRHMGVVDNFLICGNYYDTLDGAVPNGIAWPAINDPLLWPDPRTDDSTQVQSDRRTLEGDGGWVQDVVSGAEVGAVFQERAIWRMDYRGGTEIFALSRVEPSYGCLVPGLAIPFGRAILFLSENGWRMFDYTGSQPAGKSRIDQYFLNDMDFAQLRRARALADPDNTRIWISYAGAGNTNGDPNRLLIYDYALDRFTHGDEALDCLVPFLPPLTTGTMDSPSVTMDTATFDMDDVAGAAGAFALGGWSTAHKLGSFTGPNADVLLETGKIELVPGRRSRLLNARPLVEGDRDSELRIAKYEDSSEEDAFGSVIKLSRSGRFPCRHEARYHKLRLELAGSDFVNAIGFDLEAVEAGWK